MTEKDTYKVEITLTTTVDAPDDAVTEQAARKAASGMHNDSANSHYDFEGAEITPLEDENVQ